MHKGRLTWLFGALGSSWSRLWSAHSVRPIRTTNLVAWWTFDEGSGTSAADASGHQNTATIVNGAWGAGHTGSALVDGRRQRRHRHRSAVRQSSFDGGEITVMAWTYRTAEHNVAVISHGYPALFFGFHGAQFKWQFEHANGRDMACYADRNTKQSSIAGFTSRRPTMDGSRGCTPMASRSAASGRGATSRCPRSVHDVGLPR